MAVTKVRVGRDEDTFGTIAVGPNGEFVFDAVNPDRETLLRQIAETYARQLLSDDAVTQEMLDRMTAADVLARMVDRMAAKHLWCDDITGEGEGNAGDPAETAAAV